ncbi:MAG: succinate dehydrogenase assembly factor 2 [Rickettsiaceae bacterium]
MNNITRQLLIKKLLYQSSNRGCKETDIILGMFSRQNVSNMTDQELVLFENILQLPDADIYDWYTKKKMVPQDKISPLLMQILNFQPTTK